MSPEKQRIAIAEACGFKPYHEKGNTPWIENPEFHSPSGAFCLFEDLPDYLNDLNAMHEAEKVLPANLRNDYLDHLEDAVDDPEADSLLWVAVHATAAQRAEAFLKAIGKWEQ